MKEKVLVGVNRMTCRGVHFMVSTGDNRCQRVSTGDRSTEADPKSEGRPAYGKATARRESDSDKSRAGFRPRSEIRDPKSCGRMMREGVRGSSDGTFRGRW